MNSEHFNFEELLFKNSQELDLEDFYKSVDSLIQEGQLFGLPNKEGKSLLVYFNELFDTDSDTSKAKKALLYVFKKVGIRPTKSDFFHMLTVKKAHELISLYISYGIHIDTADDHQHSNALYYTCVKNPNLEATKILLKMGINVNSRNGYGDKVLDYLDEDTEAGQWLRKFGAYKSEEPDGMLFDALDCISDEDIEIILEQDRVDILETLIDRGFDLDSLEDIFEDVLENSIDYSSINTFKFLLDKGLKYVGFETPKELYERLLKLESKEHIKVFVESKHFTQDLEV